jgi:hypothetical protein
LLENTLSQNSHIKTFFFSSAFPAAPQFKLLKGGLSGSPVQHLPLLLPCEFSPGGTTLGRLAGLMPSVKYDGEVK